MSIIRIPCLTLFYLDLNNQLSVSRAIIAQQKPQEKSSNCKKNIKNFFEKFYFFVLFLMNEHF